MVVQLLGYLENSHQLTVKRNTLRELTLRDLGFILKHKYICFREISLIAESIPVDFKSYVIVPFYSCYKFR